MLAKLKQTEEKGAVSSKDSAPASTKVSGNSISKEKRFTAAARKSSSVSLDNVKAFLMAQKKGKRNSAKNVFYSSNSRIDTIKTFSEMLKHNNFIISNSTFSLIPAILKENETSKIISPFPWYRKSNKELNLKQNWIKLDNNE